MNRWVVVVIVLAFLIAPCITVQRVKAASSVTITVPDDYPTIQAAIDAASNGSTVFVRSGTYVNQSLIINKPLSLIGENEKTTILQGKSDAYPIPQSTDTSKDAANFSPLGYKISLLNFVPRIETVITLNTTDITISSFTIGNCNMGITGKGDRTQILDNTITANGESCISLLGSYMTVSNNTLSGGATGISFGGSYNNVTDNKIAGASAGISFMGSFNFLSKNNILDTDSLGMQVLGNSSTIFNNNVTGGRIGFALVSCSESIFAGNNVTKQSDRAIWLDNSNSNVIRDNYVGSNEGYAVSFSGDSDKNTFYDNTFTNGKVQFALSNKSNTWDNGKQGNYWSDYDGTDANHDGIGDKPYIINENNIDNAPLMNPAPISEFTFSSPAPITPSPNKETFSTAQAVAVSASVIVAAVGLLIFFKKSKH